MCTRYIPPDVAAMERAWHIGRINPPPWWRSPVFPRMPGPFIRAAPGKDAEHELLVGPWALLPFDKRYSTCNARHEGIERRPTSRKPWALGQRCIIPAASFDEPNWESGRNVWWRFSRPDGQPWGLAGIWSTAMDPATGEILPCYSMLTINAEAHPLMQRMHKPGEEKRMVVVLDPADWERWLRGGLDEAASCMAPWNGPIDAGPVPASGPEAQGLF
jgi:putative SOS response-associated peptidase YedK